MDSDVLTGSSVEGPGKFVDRRPHTASTIGIRVNRGTGSKTMRVMGLSSDPVCVTGFGMGIFIDNPSFHVTSYVQGERNGIGLLQQFGRGQNFYGAWINNDVAIEMQAVHHNDTNSHTFKCNGVALKSSQTDEANPNTGCTVNGPHLEYNFHVVEDQVIAFPPSPTPSTCASRWAPTPTTRSLGHDRTQDPGAYIQYSTRKVDGELIPTWKTGVAPGK